MGLDDLIGSDSQQFGTMTPQPPMQCSAEDCSYITPSNIPTYELVIRALEIHTQTVHLPHTQPHGSTKTEKPKRPTLTTGMSEAEWEFFIHRWDRYKRQTNLSGQGLLDELWATLDLELEQLAFHDNLQASTATELLGYCITPLPPHSSST